ncbi:hypothetical protein EBR96_08060, partial [bacterium]|nr:hypothetical protein [bacterium]
MYLPGGRWIGIQFWALAYGIVSRLRLGGLRRLTWDMLKAEYFYIGGACRHSGMCCKGLSLVVQGRPIDTLPDYQDVVRERPVYERFVPQLDMDGVIRHFSCRCLTSDNRCSDYAN